MTKIFTIAIVLLISLQSCKSQVTDHVELLENLKYDQDKEMYQAALTTLYPAEVTINDYPIGRGLAYFGHEIYYIADLGLQKKGRQTATVTIDLKNFKPTESDKPILFLAVYYSGDVSMPSIDDKEDVLVHYVLLEKDITEQDIKKGSITKTFTFEAKEVRTNLDSWKNSRKLTVNDALFNQLYSEYEKLQTDLNASDKGNAIEKMKVAEFETAQLRNAKKEWIVDERKALFSNHWKLLPKDSCKIKIYGDGKIATLVKKDDSIISVSAVSSNPKSKNERTTQFLNLYFHIPNNKSDLELTRFDGYAITKFGK
ncbi:hypothetical protein [Pedobacter sp. Leaf250]|uniref:hypothetical protein n=1 Tax=Pedobacter sp. Leaf250 TaxID=2876559 RepID=UPI001E2F7B2D|nr:hypothetical protein [Pedobacter sp. Leaf250]